MKPDLELVHIRKGESFAAWSHGYPFRTVRWHYHPEYEIHLIAATSGRFCIGDYAGEFTPGQLIMTGPNLPQNWVSDVPEGSIVPVRSLIVQFPEPFIEDVCDRVIEMQAIRPILDRSRRGLLFDAATSEAVQPLMRDLVDARGVKRFTLLLGIFQLLMEGRHEMLASPNFDLNIDDVNAGGINIAIKYLRDHLTDKIDEGDLAELVGQSPANFCRAFKRHTGTTFVRYRNQLRIDLACQLLIDSPNIKVTGICYDVGFSNLSNFNRHFLKLKGMSPLRFRATFAANLEAATLN